VECHKLELSQISLEVAMMKSEVSISIKKVKKCILSDVIIAWEESFKFVLLCAKSLMILPLCVVRNSCCY